MSESIAEMVLPGTYLEVRSEGLISSAAVSTGNLGIVGTASWGPVNQVVALSSHAEALDTFGPPDAFAKPTTTKLPLSLLRALQLAFAGGARNVWAVRIAETAAKTASLDLASETAGSVVTLTARQRGAWGNKITALLVKGDKTWTLTLARGSAREVISGPGTTIGSIHDALKAPGASRLVSVGDPPATPTAAFKEVTPPKPLGGGDDGAAASAANLVEGLAVLEDQPVNILLVGGFGAGATGVKDAVSGHLEATENAGRERIAVLGASTSAPADTTDERGVLSQAGDFNDDRIVLVAPGLVAPDAATGAPVALPPPYLAAVVAGSLCSLAPHTSLTNKALPIDRLDVNYPAATATQLLQNRVTVVRRKLGDQVVKAITTDPGAFTQVTVRRIVDYAKTGVRSGADPYIGKLNNARVRAALKATLDGFLSQMVLDEMLVSYQLDVTASRAQEIQGIAAVAMTLQPTFSIDFIRVTITLQ